jgi:hypothetical protein
MSDPISTSPPAEPRRRGRPPREYLPLPASPWVPPESAAAHLGISVATLWRGVADGRFTPPSYPSQKAPRFNLNVLDADMEVIRAVPRDSEAGRRAARLTEARRRKRAARSEQLAARDEAAA